MNASEMLDYALGQLDGPPRERADRDAAADPALAGSLERLGRAIDLLLDDGDPFEVPEGLGRRTSAVVAEARGRRRRRGWLDYVPVTVPFRWADVGVAAGILMASLLTLLPALHSSKRRMDQAGCGFNLQKIGTSLAQYANQHGAYPYAPVGHEKAATGTFAALLNDEGLLPDPTVLDCPCNGPCPNSGTLPSFGDLAVLRRESPDHYHRLVCWDYAYHVGYRHESGKAGAIPARLAAVIPLLADQPPHSGRKILEGNSPNHGFHGQNVLYSDSHVRWHNTRRIGPHDPDMFLNFHNKPEPGVDARDAVLVPGDVPFSR